MGSLDKRTFLFRPVVIIPHQSAPQTASPAPEGVPLRSRGSLKTPELHKFLGDNTKIDIKLN